MNNYRNMDFVIECLFFAMLRIAFGQGDLVVENHVNSLVTKISVPSSRQPGGSPEKLAPVLTVVPFNRTCQDTRDCMNIDGSMACYENTCHCKQGYVYIYHINQKCFRKAGWEEECIYTYQCVAATRNTVCRSGLCSCNIGYFYNGVICSPRPNTRSKATEVYTAALVAISCIMVAVTCILVGCVVKKSSQLRNYQNRSSHQSSRSDVFTVAEEIAAVRAADKPPTYDEVMRNEHIQFGIPPPDYPSPSSAFPLNYASAIPGPSHHSLRSISPDQTSDVILPSPPSVHELSDSSCSSESLMQRTNDVTSESDNNTTIDLETNNNSQIQTVSSPSSLPQQHNRVNVSSVTDGELGAYANLAFSLDV